MEVNKMPVFDTNLKAPFPYFGGKSMIADVVWKYLGDVKQYIEPFGGSGAVLLKRPQTNHSQIYEIINDIDGTITNVWRSIILKPEDVAKWSEFPVNHIELMARKQELIDNYEVLCENLKDAEYCNPKLAGYYIWCASSWIGRGLMRPNQIPHLTGNQDINSQIPHLTGNQGINSQRPHLTGNKGINSKRPHLTRNQGINSQIPHLARNKGQDILELIKGVPVENIGKTIFYAYQEQRFITSNAYLWMTALHARLVNVKTICGDWTRVCGGNWQERNKPVGMFFDPPYATQGRDEKIYHHDSMTVAKDVENWVIERGENPNYRIVVAGYEDEYTSLIANGWRVHKWSAGGGYSRKESRGAENRHRERLFISPHCLTEECLWKEKKQ